MSHIRRTSRAALAALSLAVAPLALPCGARAQESMQGMSGMASRADLSGLPSGPADLVLGAQIAQHCVACHQTRGHDIVGIPPISGFPPLVFARELVAFKTRTRVHTVMNAIAGSLSDEEIMATATYFSTLPSVH